MHEIKIWSTYESLLFFRLFVSQNYWFTEMTSHNVWLRWERADLGLVGITTYIGLGLTENQSLAALHTSEYHISMIWILLIENPRPLSRFHTRSLSIYQLLYCCCWYWWRFKGIVTANWIIMQISFLFNTTWLGTIHGLSNTQWVWSHITFPKR